MRSGRAEIKPFIANAPQVPEHLRKGVYMSYFEDYVADGLCCQVCGVVIDEEAKEALLKWRDEEVIRARLDEVKKDLEQLEKDIYGL